MVNDLAAARSAGSRALIVALLLTASVLVAEIAGGVLTNSLALLADAGHMVSDVLAVAMALFALWVASRPASAQQTFGYQRAEVLAAAANGGALVLVSAYIFWQAAKRFADPPHVDSGPMLAVAAAGLIANLASAYILYPQQARSINLRGAFYHVVGDLIGSIGVIVAGVVMLATGWFLADPMISVFIAVIILISAAPLLRESLVVLLEAVPEHIDMVEVETALMATPGVAALHDLHIWTVTSGLVSLSCHCELTGDRDSDQVLADLCDMLHERFAIHHVTIQPELLRLHGDDAIHSLPRCTSVIGHQHRPVGAP